MLDDARGEWRRRHGMILGKGRRQHRRYDVSLLRLRLRDKTATWTRLGLPALAIDERTYPYFYPFHTLSNARI